MKIFRFIVTLALLCGLAAGFLSFINSKTSSVISQNLQKEAVQAVMDKVLKNRYSDINISTDPDSIFINIQTVDTETKQEKTVRLIKATNSEGRLVATIVENSSLIAYGGPMKILVGIDSSGTVIGSTVLSHTETPGLGDQIQKEWFQTQFLNLTTDSSGIQIKKFGGRIESISGASISSNAFTTALREALFIAKQNSTSQQDTPRAVNSGEHTE